MTVVTYSLAGVILILAFFLVQLLLRVHSLLQRIEQLESKANSQQVSINGLTAGAVGVDRRLRGIEERESAIVHRQESIESQQAEGGTPFGEAIRLVQQGATAERLIDELGLSPSEASLIAMIHGGGNE